MHVLIVESKADRSDSWARLLREKGWHVAAARTAEVAVALMDRMRFEVILLDLELDTGNALTVPIYAGYRQPEARIVVVTGSTVFNDGSIFELCSNACAYLNAAADPEDIVTLVDHHGREAGGAIRSQRLAAGAAH